jgi:hypothetical protein
VDVESPPSPTAPDGQIVHTASVPVRPRISTKGNYASGAVLGTRWLTSDLCGGTLIRVLRDRVAVTNLVNHRHVTVTAGHSYLAKAQ